MSEKKKTFMRNNLVYRSLRRSSSKVAYSLKKKVSSVHKTLENNILPRKAMQTLNESFGSPCTPNRFNGYDYCNEGLSVTPLASTSAVRSVVSPSSSQTKQRMSSRLSKQLARCRIWEIQSPKRCGGRPIPKRLQVEVNELARGLQDLHAAAEKAKQTAAKST